MQYWYHETHVFILVAGWPSACVRHAHYIIFMGLGEKSAFHYRIPMDMSISHSHVENTPQPFCPSTRLRTMISSVKTKTV